MTNKEWFKSRKWGIFNHYLSSFQMEDFRYTKGEKLLSWDDTVNSFDVEAYAKRINDIGAGYVIFTMGQSSKYWCAPNEAFNQITGYKTGEACSTRDLIADLIIALNKYDIPLFLYFTGCGPSDDKQAGERMGFRHLSIADQIDDKFIKHWCMVLREYSLRYGKGIKGWWIDGCYDFYGYNDKYLAELKDAATAGNSEALVSLNNGTENKNPFLPKFKEFYNEDDCHVRKLEKVEDALLTGLYDATGYMEKRIEKQYRNADDYTAGERNEFEYYPTGEELPCVWHILSFLGFYNGENPYKKPYQSNGSGWGAFGSRYSAEYMYNYVKKVINLDGVVSIDISVLRDGTFDEGQLETLRLLKDLR